MSTESTSIPIYPSYHVVKNVGHPELKQLLRMDIGQQNSAEADLLLQQFAEDLQVCGWPLLVCSYHTRPVISILHL